MEIIATDRGFAYGTFTDKYNNKCSIQESSAAMEPCIWLGIDNPELTVFEAGMGNYIKTPMPSNFSVPSRMHLTQEQAKELIPLLQKFVETGLIK